MITLLKVTSMMTIVMAVVEVAVTEASSSIEHEAIGSGGSESQVRCSKFLGKLFHTIDCFQHSYGEIQLGKIHSFIIDVFYSP